MIPDTTSIKALSFVVRQEDVFTYGVNLRLIEINLKLVFMFSTKDKIPGAGHFWPQGLIFRTNFAEVYRVACDVTMPKLNMHS